VLSLVIITSSTEETRDAGERLGRVLRPGDAVALCGELGTGKTVFVQGLARGLGTEPDVLVTSPTFVILHEYPGRTPLYHFDFYRLMEEREAWELGVEDYLEGDGVAAAEWADKFPALFGARTIWIEFRSTGENERRLELRAGQEFGDERWAMIEGAVKDFISRKGAKGAK